jgi:integrase
MAVYRDEKTGKWFIDYYYRGKRIRECAGTNKRAAEQALSIRKAEILQGRFKIETLKPSPRFEHFAQDFLDWSQANKRSFQRDRCLVKNLLAAFRGKLLSEITPWLIEKYKKDRQAATVHGRPIKPATVNREVACLKRMFSLAIEWGRATEHPGAKVKLLREDNKLERILTPEEQQQLLAACTDHSRPFVVTALHTGMRLGEILNLTWEQVDFERGYLTVTHTKNGKSRKIPMNPTLTATLKAGTKTGPYVFGGQKPYGAIKTAFQAALRRAGISRCRFHDLRHTFASSLVAAGVDLVTVKELLGHSEIAMTMRYSHPTPENKRRAVNLLTGLVEGTDGQYMDSKAEKSLQGKLVQFPRNYQLTNEQAPVAQMDRARVS